ncbi:MAG: hypothetical protein ACRD0S_03730, partial [Acidimicrobiales bacterium]
MPAEVSIVLVLGPAGPQADALLEAARRAHPAGTELIVVVRDGEAPGRAMDLRIVRAEGGVAFGAAANLGAAATARGLLCFPGPGIVPSEGWLAPLLAAMAPGAIGAAGHGSRSGFCVRRSAFVASGGFEPASAELATAATELA